MSTTYCLSSNFSVLPSFRQVITSKQWKTFLQNHDRHVFCQGHLRELKAKNLGAGMMEVSSKPLYSCPS